MVIGNHIGLPFGKHKGVPKPPITEVIWNPNVTSNVSPTNTQFFNLDGSVLENGTVVSVGVKVYLKVTFEEGADVELHGVTINGTSLVLESTPTGDMYAWTVDVRSPQQVVIDASEFIRYEDIKQPYPAIIHLKQDSTPISWGDKLKVGSEITYVRHVNLLPDLYTISGGVQYNGVSINWNSIIVVEKSMVFTNFHTYKKTNEPNCILSNQILPIPNESYKYLGHQPDLSGHGNHGVFNNFEFAGMSGANGYTEQTFSNWRYNIAEKRAEFTISNDVKLNIAKVVMARGAILYTLIGDYTTNSIQRYKVTGVDENHPIVFGNDAPFDALLTVTTDGEYEVDWKTYGKNPCIFATWTGDCNITIEQIGEYEGAICFNGVNNYMTIPTLSHGAKQVLMKVRSFKPVCAIYEQRTPTGVDGGWIPTFCVFMNNQAIAYVDGNNGNTYIDGILNTSIQGNQLVNITHNITVTNENTKFGNTQSPLIGKLATFNTSYAQMALFTFMSFPEISTEEEIKELNDIVGIEGGYVESPNYYWDAYGKKNTDTDRNLIADQVSKDVANALEVKNVAYNSESGYTDNNGLLLDGVEDHAVNTVIPAVTDFTVIAKREFPESALVNNQTFLVKGDVINGNNNVNSLLMECYYGAQNYIISFSYQQIVPLEKSKISWITPTSYNGNALTKGSGVDSAGLTIGRYKDLYRKAVFYKLMFYTKTIDQLSINMLKNLFERDELIDVNNPIFKKHEEDN